MKQLITVLIVIALVGVGAYFLLQDKAVPAGTTEGAENMEAAAASAMIESEGVMEDGTVEVSGDAQVQ